jgi:hypothetical protein
MKSANSYSDQVASVNEAATPEGRGNGLWRDESKPLKDQLPWGRDELAEASFLLRKRVTDGAPEVLVASCPSCGALAGCFR